MKKILYSLFFLFGLCQITNAQIVNIPDANFKARLLQASPSNQIAKNALGQDIKIDTNNDGEIQISEALNVYQLNIGSNFQPKFEDLTGIEAFVNLTHLMCFHNNLTELDLSSNINLTDLNCFNNLLVDLNISNNINLTKLFCSNNNLTMLDISNNVNLVELNLGINSLTEIDFSNNINLTTIYIDKNSLTELDFSNNVNLEYLFCSHNSLTELIVLNCINLTELHAFTTLLTELDLSNNVSLTQLTCVGSLTEIDLSNNINLTYISLVNNNLTELDISNNINLVGLDVAYNSGITVLDVSNNTKLISLDCKYNNLSELDLSNNPELKNLYAGNNSQLSYLNIKNGGNLNSDVSDWATMWNNYPDNIYICADEEEATNIAPYLNLSEATDQVIATYCYIPGANYNTITGSVFFTDSGNCDEDDITILTKVTIDDGTEEGASFTNQNGEYIFFTQEGEFTITPDIENPGFFNITPAFETITFEDNDNNEEVVNFCITPNGVHNDLEIVIAPINPARPGFEATYKIVYRNKGNQVMSQANGISFTYDDDYLDFVSATQVPSIQNAGTLMWSYENLKPFESRSFVITMQVNTPTDPDFPVNIDDVFTFTAVILPQTDDENEPDNTYVFNQTVVGAFDPNDITCIEGDVVLPEYIGEELHYVIRFENTGNYYAENVVVVMEIDTEKYDVDSVRLLNTSHNAVAQIKNDVLEVFFNQIMLDSGGHGNILLVMKSINSLSEGDSVQSKADIYFDFNYPIITNDAVTLFQATMSVEENIKNIDLKFYPNPTTDYFNIISEAMIQSVELYDVSGRLVRTSLVNDFESRQNVSNLNNGIYILKIKTQQGEVTGKIVKK